MPVDPVKCYTLGLEVHILSNYCKPTSTTTVQQFYIGLAPLKAFSLRIYDLTNEVCIRSNGNVILESRIEQCWILWWACRKLKTEGNCYLCGINSLTVRISAYKKWNIGETFFLSIIKFKSKVNFSGFVSHSEPFQAFLVLLMIIMTHSAWKKNIPVSQNIRILWKSSIFGCQKGKILEIQFTGSSEEL